MQPELEVRAELDVPGETSRQIRVFVVWLLCLAAAAVVAVARKPDISASSSVANRTVHEQRLAAWRRERLYIVLVLGIAVPAATTYWITRRRRRGGAHPRGIIVDIVNDGDLRIWGRGYGERVQLARAQLSERLVDVYTGRMGAWRQRRVRVVPALGSAGGRRGIELATVATAEDSELTLGLEGGEGDCVELSRDDYLAVLAKVREIVARRDTGQRQDTGHA